MRREFQEMLRNKCSSGVPCSSEVTTGNEDDFLLVGTRKQLIYRGLSIRKFLGRESNL